MNKLLKSIILTFFLMWSGNAYGAEATTLSDDGLTLTITDITADWHWDDSDSWDNAKYSDGVRVNWIRFHPGATDDAIILTDDVVGDASTLYYFQVKCADAYDDRIQYYSGAKMKLFLDVTDCVVSTANDSITIQLWPTQEP